MSFPTTEVINTWFQDAHTTAVAAGGSVYVMEKRAEQEVVNSVLRWACLTMLDELEDLNYPDSSRVRLRVAEMLSALYDMTSADDDTEDEEFVDDYNDDEDEEDEDEEDEEDKTTKKFEINLNTCKIGQKLMLRNAKIVTYQGPSTNTNFPHRAGDSVYTHKGEYYLAGEKNKWDIVEILPLEDEATTKEPSVQVDTDLAIEIVGALLKAITSK